MKFITHEEDDFEVGTKHHNKVTIPKSTLEVPQVESLTEAVEFFGGEQKIIDGLNDLIWSRAKAGALALVRNAAADASIEDAIKKAISYAKEYNPSIERVSKATILEGVDKLKEMKEEMKGMTAEQLMALFESTLKI